MKATYPSANAVKVVLAWHRLHGAEAWVHADKQKLHGRGQAGREKRAPNSERWQ